MEAKHDRKIKMVDLHGQYQRIRMEIDQAIQRVLDSTEFIQGPDVSTFERSLSSFVGACVVSCANGTDALQIALMALDLEPFDEVILPVHTYVATAEVIALLGLTPVFVDVDPKTFNIRIEDIAKNISKKTRAIVPVHLYGQCADMEQILALAADKNIAVIEDAAQALGAVYTFSDGSSKQAGTMGLIGTTSFFPSKNLGCFGDGGAIFVKEDQMATRIRMIANHGQQKKYHHDCVGVNSRLDTMQAAILNVKLKYLVDYTTRRNRVAAFYDRALSGIPGVMIPSRSLSSTHVFHQYTIVSDRRDQLKTYLEGHGIPTMIYYPVPLHLQKAYRSDRYPAGSFPISEQLSKTVLSLPIHTEMTDEDLEYICSIIRSFK